MSDQPNDPTGDDAQEPPQEPIYGPTVEPVQYDPVGARVPEHVARGVMSTGVLVLDGPQEFVIDFVQGLGPPPSLGARVVLTPAVMSQFIEALKANLRKYEETFGKPPEMPRPDPKRRPGIKEVYEGLKLPDEQLSGAYANAVRIMHSPAEFNFDFITRFYPTAAVAARVYMAAPQAPRLLESLTASYQHFLNKRQQPPDQMLG